MIIIEELYSEAVSFLNKKLGDEAKTAVIAGSGIFNALSDIKILKKIPYETIPGFPKPLVRGHGSELILAVYYGRPTLFFTGRFHLYEGKTFKEILAPVIISHRLGVKSLIVTNAAGGLNPRFETGGIMLINDMLNFTFRDFSKEIHNIFPGKKILINQNIVSSIQDRLIETGVMPYTGTYIQVTGPSYETPAEIKMYRDFGGDAIGMSTYPEIALALQLGMNAAGCSVITNTLSYSNPHELSHSEVIKAAIKSEKNIAGFLSCAVDCM